MPWAVGTVYTRPRFWKKGNRVSTTSDSLIIKIGGDPNDKKSKLQNNRIKSTKYTLITFLPQNLLEQFRRIANFYFLIMSVISIVIDSPVSPLTSLIPLIFVIAVTAAKQGYEDFLRYRADNMVNNSYVTVIRNGCEVDIQCQEIIQGDLVRAARDCDVPCDLVLINSSDPNGKCHITTANLDGETNLKTLMVPKGLPNINIDKLHTLGVIECEQPRTDLYTFNGRIELGPMHRNRDYRSSTFVEVADDNRHILPLMTENLLLRGSRIKNTEYAIGCAVYTGQNTKLSLNSRLTRNKMSSSEKYVNKFLVFFLVMLIAIVTVSYFLKRFHDMYSTAHNKYLGEIISNYVVSQFLQDYFSFLILFNYLIPISLYVTIEMHKFLGSFFMEWDHDLYDPETNQPFIVNTSDLNEELGQVNILFSDKTGTLTKNEMIFQQCSVNGRKYMFREGGLQEDGKPNVVKLFEFKEDIFKFFETLSVCHTVQVGGNENDGSQENIPTGKTEAAVQNTNGVTHEEQLIEVISYNNSAEETTTVPQFDADEIDFIRNAQDFSPPQNVTYLNDFSPLLNGKKHDLLPLTPEPITIIANESLTPFKRSLEAGNKANLRRPMSLNESPFVGPANLNPSVTFKNPRPLSIEFKRTISAVDNERLNHLTHRRTQSYAATTNHNRQEYTAPTSRPISFLRQTGSVTNMREYYAAPSFMESTLLERKESIRRKNEIKSAIELLDYQASSPDEKALVEACAKVGFIYTGDIDNVSIIKLQPYSSAYLKKIVTDRELKFERLHTLEFTSDRKRMSSIIKDSNGQIWLFTKGAESHVLPLCQNSNRQLLAKTQEHINDFAKIGLRTLAVARRKLSEEEFNNFTNEIVAAGNSLTDRKQLMEGVQAKLERNLEIVGATAVEDALQDHVKDTLESLRHAGIKVWVLTGDKVETALNIALACGHIPETAFKYFITECQTDEHVREHLDILERELDDQADSVFSLLIDGSSLSIALTSFSTRFRDLSIRCRAVLCCRLSPLQKCEVVHLMKTVPSKPITAAIGDGANDVSMIQEAHVGLGIVGKEGRQAARCADYAFANFHMLKKVMLVHGYYYTQRLALLVLYFFYKNLVFMLIQLYFQANSMFSTQTVYDSLFLTMYNVIYTSLPVLFISLTEKLHPEKELMSNPPLYQENAGNKRLTWKYFIGWMLLAVYHSLVIYVSGYIIWSNNSVILSTPHTVNFFCFGTFMIHNVVVVVNLKLWLEAKYQSYWFIVTVLGSIFAFFVSTLIYNFFDLDFDGDMLWVYNKLLSSMTFWLLFFMIQIAALLPDYLLLAGKGMNLRIGQLFPGNSEMRTRQSNKKRIETTYL